MHVAVPLKQKVVRNFVKKPIHGSTLVYRLMLWNLDGNVSLSQAYINNIFNYCLQIGPIVGLP